MDNGVVFTSDWRTFCKELRPCDVLVFDSLGFESGLVQWADKAPVNHASLVLDNNSLIEANQVDKKDVDPHEPTPGAVQQVPFEKRFVKQDVISATALRHDALLGGDRPEAQAVLARAREDLGQRKFAYLAIAALGPAALRRSYASDKDQGDTLTHSFGLLLFILDKILRNLTTYDRWSLSCSEFVYRCFDESNPRLPLTVTEPLTFLAEAQPAWLTPEQDARERELYQILDQHNATRASIGPRPAAITTFGAGSPVVADRVTPGDLWRCPELNPVAVLHRGLPKG
jgi:hypothetical protein